MSDSYNMKDAVQAGITYLDSKVPGWYNKIDLNRLEMQLSDHCVCGQLGKEQEDCNQFLGFFLPSIGKLDYLGPKIPMGCYFRRLRGWEALQKMWVARITERRNIAAKAIKYLNEEKLEHDYNYV